MAYINNEHGIKTGRLFTSSDDNLLLSVGDNGELKLVHQDGREIKDVSAINVNQDVHDCTVATVKLYIAGWVE